MEEFRCTEETAITMMKEDTSSMMGPNTFGAALGVPLVVSTDVPEGKLQFWRNDEMIREIDI
jgi:hypothetical protein